MSEALRRLDFFVPPPVAKHFETEFLNKFAPRFRYYKNLYAMNQDQLSMWRDWVDDCDFQNFRGETFLSQAAAHHPSVLGSDALHDAYRLQLQYAQSIDRLGALETFEDDGLFGGCRFDIEGKIVSRDILDSVLELNFIALHAGIAQSDPLVLVDIGAGWGVSFTVS